jgi:pseudaminic acid synthase
MHFASELAIGRHRIGPRRPCCLVAEISANHGGSIERAEAVIRAAADAGADAVKLQTYTADTMTLDCDTELFRSKNPLRGRRTLYSIYAEGSMPWEWQGRLAALANDLGMECFSTPFDATAVDFLESLHVPCHKVASFELVDIPLLKIIAATGKPVIMSTGMATLAEIDEAVRTLQANGTKALILLKCTSAYPASVEEMHLRTIPHLAATFGCLAGLSDHTLETTSAVVAVSLGACLIEKHFTLSRAAGGLDAAFSIEPDEFRRMVREVRVAEKALGRVNCDLTDNERTSVVLRRSLFVVKDMKAGELFSKENVRAIRPGHGLHTRHFEDILGRRAARDIVKGTPMAWNLCGGYAPDIG